MTSSAAGMLAMLSSADPRVQGSALQRLYPIVDVHWCEISEFIASIEELSEQSSFQHASLASAVASKCYYHMEEYNDALRHALSSEKYFDTSIKSQYVDTMLSCSIDRYILSRQDKNKADDPGGDTKSSKGDDNEDDISFGEEFATQLETIVESMFQRCFNDGSYEQALGIALEARRVDMVRASIQQSGSGRSDMLVHAFDLCQSVVSSRTWRREVLTVLVDIYKQNDTNDDYVSLCACLQALDDASSVSTLLDDLLRNEEESKYLLAYQVAFDLCENENQKFSQDISTGLPINPFTKITPSTTTPSDTSAESGSALSEDQMMANIEASRAALAADGEAVTPTAAATDAPFPEDHIYWSKLNTLRSILVGGLSVRLYLQFLYKNNRADLILLGQIKDKLPERNSVCHGACVTAHSYMHCGTTVDTFLRKNLEWLSKASNWNKFNAIASMGVVHKGHLAESKTLLEPYLPTDASTSTRPYQEGGALYALGLIHANNSDDTIVDYILNHLAQASIHPTEQTSEILQHGACLGLGLAAMGTGKMSIYDQLRNVLVTDRAVAGEASGIAMGLLLLGTPKTGPIEEMLQYAKDTKHDKTIRGLGLGISLTMFGQEEQADHLINRLSKEGDFQLRTGAMWTVASAYAGTTNNGAIRRLLHVAVSDVNDDVRRTAVIALGFVMLRVPDQLPRLVSLLAESYNPHVRYGACMAIGVACAGSGATNKAALEILMPMLEDKESFVRQGALMATSLVLMQENEKRCASVKTLRAKIISVIEDKHQSIVAKFGAVVGAGILDAGGRNMCVALTSRTGFLRRGAVVGMMVWLNHWYWHPLLNFFSMALTPTAIIGVNKDMKMPEKFTLNCLSKPSLFAYPKALEEAKEEVKERVKTAVLSTTAKAKAKAKLKTSSTGDDDVDMKDAKDDEEDAAKQEEAEKKKEAEKKETKKEEPEAESFTLSNPSRVTYAQYEFVTPMDDNRYRPVIASKRNLGVIVLTDSTPKVVDDALMEIEAPPKAGAEGPEPDCPEPFDWIPPEHRSTA